MKPYPPLGVTPYSRPSPRIVRLGNGRVNMSATLAGMKKGQTILIRMNSKADLTRVTSAAGNVKVRIKIEGHPAMFTILVTSLGPQRKRSGLTQTAPLQRNPTGQGPVDLQPRIRCFHPAKQKPKPASLPGPPTSTSQIPDIFS